MCENGKCEYRPTLNRVARNRRTQDEIRLAQLWKEVELPKDLGLTPEQYKQYLKERKTQ